MRRPRRILFALSVVLAAGATTAGATAAGAAPSLVTDSYSLSAFFGDPAIALAGSATLVGTPAGRATDVVRVFVPGRPASVLAGARLHTGQKSSSLKFVASASRLVTWFSGYTAGYKGSGSGGSSSQVLASGPLGGLLETLGEDCRLAPSLDSAALGNLRERSAFAVGGEVVAYDIFDCIVVHDYASGLQRRVVLDATLEPVVKGVVSYSSRGSLVRVAGRLIAYRAGPPGGEGPGKVVVYDIDLGRALYSAPLPQSADAFGGDPTFDLQPDGTLVIASRESCAATVSTIAEPTPRPLGIPVCEVRRVRDDRALVLVPAADRHRLLAWTELVGPVAHEIADLGRGGMSEVTPSDMSETEAVYALGGCRYPSVYRTALLDPGRPPATPASCPVLISPHSATLGRGTLRVRLTCPLGCRGHLFASIGYPRALRRGHGTELSEYGENYALAPGGTTTLDLLAEGASLSAVQIRRKLERDRRLRLGVYLTTERPAGYGDEAQRRTLAIVPVKLARGGHR